MDKRLKTHTSQAINREGGHYKRFQLSLFLSIVSAFLYHYFIEHKSSTTPPSEITFAICVVLFVFFILF